MTSEPSQDTPAASPGSPAPAAASVSLPAGGAVPAAPAAVIAVPRGVFWALVLLALAALLVSGALWQKLGSIQEHLARQSADAGAQSAEARAMAKQAQDLARDSAARQAVAEARLSEVTLQRSQLEELMQSLSRSRDENLVVDIESALRLAQQQAQLTASVEPLLAALRTADQRVTRAAQPRLAPLQRAIGRDIDRIKSASVTDLPGLLARLDELGRQVDDLPVLNAVLIAQPSGAGLKTAEPVPPSWWEQWLLVLRREAGKLLRVSRIDQPEAALLSPEQTFFLRENLKLKLLNARFGLLARQLEAARADLSAASGALNKYFDPASRKTQAMATLLQQVQGQMKAVELPRIDETLAALATAAAGR